ncbi:hypothetical protein ES319_A08G137500v1 [Gossypium barbadense]|uniref:Uncharacterized protein n=2 Tax=Gossypium TaxID=3633 RepID=A0A5J5URM1_GOSBA|nr:hypothetical protein ES319_A08G137500v1 [Gossypium barbadense]TYH06367.1 hypothetical protein ES288_A08G150700v1 [Gossypium darwinii]
MGDRFGIDGAKVSRKILSRISQWKCKNFAVKNFDEILKSWVFIATMINARTELNRGINPSDNLSFHVTKGASILIKKRRKKRNLSVKRHLEGSGIAGKNKPTTEIN